MPVTRAFNQFLNLANIAEQHYRARFRRVEDYKPGSQPELGDLIARARKAGHSPRKLVESLASMRVELVLTAHPTEVIRRTLIQKYDAIDDCLTGLESSVDSVEKRSRVHGRLEELISQAWHTDEIRHERPTPVDEAKWGFAVIENSLWQAVPDFHRDLDNLLLEAAGERLPLDAAPLRFASWMGGDRDGNPNVTAKVTREVLLLGRWMAADLYLRDLDQLKAELSMWKANSACAPRWLMPRSPIGSCSSASLPSSRRPVTGPRQLSTASPMRARSSSTAISSMRRCWRATARCAMSAWIPSPTACCSIPCAASPCSA